MFLIMWYSQNEYALLSNGGLRLDLEFILKKL